MAQAAAAPTDDETVGARVRRRREAAGLSQFTLAAKAGVTPGTVHGLERDKRVPRVDTLDAIAVALGCTIDELVNP